MDIKYKKSGVVFNQHQYWTKQPLESIDFFIKKFSKEGETVLDPFSGTGMTGLSGMRLGRNVILSDISRICQHISKGYTTSYKIDDKLLSSELSKLLQGLENNYKTNCLNCKKEAEVMFSVIEEVYLDSNNVSLKQGSSLFWKIKNNDKIDIPKIKNKSFYNFDLIQLSYKCSCSKTKLYKDPDNDDIEKHTTFVGVEEVLPNDFFFGKEPVRNFKKGIKRVKDIYSPRNLSILSILKKRINEIKNSEVRQLFLFAFSGVLFNCSLMSRYRKYENTSIKMGTYYIPPVIKDNNVIRSFTSKVKNIHKSNNQLLEDKNLGDVLVLGDSAGNLKQIKDNSIDYIYTDPPYGDILSYSELNLVWESWLDCLSDNENEMIVSKEVGLTEQRYFNLFKDFINESSRVLKKGKVLTLVFHHPNIYYWEEIQNIFVGSYFEPIITNSPVRLVSENKTSSQHSTSKKTQSFLVFSFVNTKKNNFSVLENIPLDIEKEIISKIEMSLIYGQDVAYDTLINELFTKYKITRKYLDLIYRN